jgi:hypothetical protein
MRLALLNFVLIQYDLSNTTLFKLAPLKLVFYNNENVKSALGMLIFAKSSPENNGLYKFTAVIAAAAQFSIVLLILD